MSITKRIDSEIIERLDLPSIAEGIVEPNEFTFDMEVAQVYLCARNYSADELERLAKDLRALETLEDADKLS